MQNSSVTIDGTKYEFKWDFDELAEAEEIVGCNLLQAVGNLGRGISAKELRGLFYALLVNRPRPALESIKPLFRLDTLPRIATAIGGACMAAVPKPAKVMRKKS